MNTPVIRLFALVVVLFAVLVAFTSRWTVFEAEALRENPNNRRLLFQEQLIERGIIRAADGEVIAGNRSLPRERFERRYPLGELFAHPVGFTSLERGRTGIEDFYNDPLTGRRTDAIGALERLLGPQKVGDDLRTTLSTRAQEVAYDGLAGRPGAVVALDVETGAVRTLAATPTFDPTDPANAETFNRATQGLLAPGSTFKVVTAAAALDSGRYEPGSPVDGSNGKVISGTPLNNFGDEDFGPIDLTTALTNSVNTVWAEVAEKLGKDTMAEYMEKFGFYDDPPMDYPDDQMVPSGEYGGRGRLLSPTSGQIDVGRMAIGQDKLLVTPLQMATVAQTVGNGGVRMEPRLVEKIVDPDGRTIDEPLPEEAERVMSSDSASALTEMMRNVVREGTGTAAALEGVELAGKTGTAEIDIEAGINNLWFVGFTGKVAVAVVLERQSGGFGGTDAAPIAKAVLEALGSEMSPTRVERDTIIDGRYRVLKRIGSGGMAEVYCAEDQQLGRRVALKLLHRRFADDEQFVERFRREASSAAGLSHPNIVGIFDRGEWDGTYYIAMEFVEGRTLKDIVRERGAAPPEAAADITLQILRAARFAHKRGIVHRDIKPHNVLIDNDGRVRVTDFGIARAGVSDMTETGSVMGTAQYLSPEQAQGKPVDARSDLYSTGVVLYELLTGRVPFDAESPVSVALMQVSEPPVPPMEVNPEVPPALDAVTLRAMEKDPGRRYQDADEFIAALESARAAPMEILAPPPIVEEVVEEDEHGRRWWLWLIALLALAAIALGLYLLLRPEQLIVPRVVGLRSATASQIIKNRGFRVEVVNVANADVERDRVAAQDPLPNTEAPEGSVVELTVSTGPGEAPVPTVTGLPREEAEQEVRDAGFEPQVERSFSDTVPKGRVIATTPPGGTSIERGSTVVLDVSQGREQVEVPDVVGESESNARSALEGAGLRVGEVTEEASEEEPGTVIEQTPGGGEEVARGEAVDLVVAEAVAVPDVVDSTEEEATTTLEEAGFEVRVREQTVTDPEQDGVVIEQSPAPDEERRQGSTVTITVGRLEAAATATPTPTATP